MARWGVGHETLDPATPKGEIGRSCKGRVVAAKIRGVTLDAWDLLSVTMRLNLDLNFAKHCCCIITCNKSKSNQIGNTFYI